MIVRDKYGWPVERFIGKPFTSFMRTLFLMDIGKTLKGGHRK